MLKLTAEQRVERLRRQKRDHMRKKRLIARQRLRCRRKAGIGWWIYAD